MIILMSSHWNENKSMSPQLNSSCHLGTMRISWTGKLKKMFFRRQIGGRNFSLKRNNIFQLTLIKESSTLVTSGGGEGVHSWAIVPPIFWKLHYILYLIKKKKRSIKNCPPSWIFIFKNPSLSILLTPPLLVTQNGKVSGI